MSCILEPSIPISILAVAKGSCPLSNLRSYQSPRSNSVGGSVPETPSKHTLTLGALLGEVPPDNTGSYCLTSSFSSQLKCPRLREAFPSYPTQRPHSAHT